MKRSRRIWFAGILAVVASLAAGLGIAQTKVRAQENRAECCCIVENDELVCTITGEELEECCCK